MGTKKEFAMKCKKCGAEIRENAKFCGYCGQEQQALSEKSGDPSKKKQMILICAILAALLLAAGAILQQSGVFEKQIETADTISLEDSYRLEDGQLNLGELEVSYPDGGTETIADYDVAIDGTNYETDKGIVRASDLKAGEHKIQIQWERKGQKFQIAETITVEETNQEEPTTAPAEESKPDISTKANAAYTEFLSQKFEENSERASDISRALAVDMNNDGIKEVLIQWDMLTYSIEVYTYSQKNDEVYEMPENDTMLNDISLYCLDEGSAEFNFVQRGDTTGTENNVLARKYRITEDGFELVMELSGLLIPQEDSQDINGEPVSYEEFVETYDTVFNPDYVRTQPDLWEEMVESGEFESLDDMKLYLNSELGTELQ